MHHTSLSFIRRLSSAFACLALACSASAVDIIAHRGASYDAPENTLAAFKLGWKQGADAVELDIWLGGDGRIVVIHDESLKRTTGVDQNLSELSSAELRKLDAGSWKDPKWKGERIPTLDEALKAIPRGKRLVIEIKSHAEIVPELARVIAKSKRKPEDLIIISFKYDSVVAAKKQFPKVPVYYLSSFKQNKETGAWTPTFDELIEQAKAAKADGINVSYKGPITAEVIRKTHAAGLKFLVWTVNDPELAKRLVVDGVDAITTDRPAWLREQLKAP
jgi:glycerophosphoryl diester phosphodiesterase